MTLQRAQALAEAGDIEGAWAIVKELMSHEPNNPHLLLAATFCMQKAGNWPVAYHLANANIQRMPHRPEPYLNLAAACDQLYELEEGLMACDMALQRADTDKLRGVALMNRASLLINHGRFAEALPVCEQAMTVNPSAKARGNLGMCQLALHDWAQGWDNYAACLGTSERARIDYGTPDWRGEAGRLVIHGEQGLGDEISFASMLPQVEQAVVDCDYRLKGLFARSFPHLTVHGGRWQKPYSGPVDFQCAIGDLGRMFRRDAAAFPRQPYLVADDLRRSQWRHLKAQVNKPLVGIAWTGGMAHTASKYRQMDQSMLRTLVGGLDAHFVSLEYKERQPVAGIHVYPHATLTDDYDDTAALVAECDLVITIQTAVAHLAGSLGTPCLVLVPQTSQWRYAQDDMPWYGDRFSVYKAPWNLSKVIDDARHHLRSLPARTAEAA